MSFRRFAPMVLALVVAFGQAQASCSGSGGELEREPVGPMFYGIEVSDAVVAQLAESAPVAASTLLAFRAQPKMDPVDMRQNVSYFSAKPNARSVRALLGGDEDGMRLADPLVDGERLRAIFRTIDDASAQDGRMTLSIEAIGDNTAERTTLVELEKVEGAEVSADIADGPAPVYRVAGISFVD